MNMSDVLKVGAGVLLAFMMIATVVGLCYLVLDAKQDSIRLQNEVAQANTRAQETASRIAAENEASRREIETLQANLSDLQRKNDLTVELALQLYREQQDMANKTSDWQPQNITIIFPSGHATGTPMYQIPEDQQQTNNLSDGTETWKPSCWNQTYRGVTTEHCMVYLDEPNP